MKRKGDGRHRSRGSLKDKVRKVTRAASGATKKGKEIYLTRSPSRDSKRSSEGDGKGTKGKGPNGVQPIRKRSPASLLQVLAGKVHEQKKSANSAKSVLRPVDVHQMPVISGLPSFVCILLLTRSLVTWVFAPKKPELSVRDLTWLPDPTTSRTKWSWQG